jgi:hypothetical protein
VRVGGAPGFAVVEAALQDLPARRVRRHRSGTGAEPGWRGALVDVAYAKVPDLVAGSAVQQREDAEQRLVRVDAVACDPGAKQLALLVQGKGPAGEPAAGRTRLRPGSPLAASARAGRRGRSNSRATTGLKKAIIVCDPLAHASCSVEDNSQAAGS